MDHAPLPPHFEQAAAALHASGTDVVHALQHYRKYCYCRTTVGTFVIELLLDEVPITCSNFTDLVERGFYNGLHFHRVSPQFMVQFGCPFSREFGHPRMGWGTGPAGKSTFQLLAEVRHVRRKRRKGVEGPTVTEPMKRLKLPGDRATPTNNKSSTTTEGERAEETSITPPPTVVLRSAPLPDDKGTTGNAHGGRLPTGAPSGTPSTSTASSGASSQQHSIFGQYSRDISGCIEDEYIPTATASNQPRTVAVANVNIPDSGGSQFFINLCNNNYLDWFSELTPCQHLVFGKVIAGWETVEGVVDEARAVEGLPTKPVQMLEMMMSHETPLGQS